MLLAQINKKGFTLLEMLVVVVIVGIMAGVLYTVWLSNWSGFDSHTVRADLLNEANVIVAQISRDGRNAKRINWNPSNPTEVVFVDSKSAPFITYRFTQQREFQSEKTGVAPVILSRLVDTTDTTFTQVGNSIILNLVLSDDVFGKEINIKTSVEIFPRNSTN